MEIFECSICDNRYDAALRRPRSLPCGHGFCTLCIESCITRGNKSCPVCRVGHGANSANDLPVSFLLEESIHKATISTSQKLESESVSEKGSIDSCPKHLGVPIHFQCRTHNVKVCHSCTVLEHNPSSCNLISLDDLMKEKKETQIVTVQEQIQNITDTQKDLKALHQKNVDDVNKEKCKKQALEKEVELLLTKIEQSNQEILKKQKPQEQIQDAIQSCQKNKEALEMQVNKLRAASNNKIITQECQFLTNENTKSQIWEETLRKEMNLKVQEKYAQVKNNGILRCAKVHTEEGKMIIPTLSKELILPSSAKLIQEADLNLTSANTTIFLDLSAHGCNLGRIYICVLPNRVRGQQFVMLALGTNGSTLKGTRFLTKDSRSIGVKHYITESKSKSCEILLPMEIEVKEKVSKGSLYRWNANQAGFQIKTNNEKKNMGGYFGDVISGLEVIDRIASDEFAIKEILINECGIVLGY